MPEFLIAYDVAHPRRLRRVARVLERHGVRVQYSVFLYRGTDAALAALLDELGQLIRPSEDVIQAWPLPAGADPGRYALGAVRPVDAAAVVAAATTRFVIRSTHDPSSSSGG